MPSTSKTIPSPTDSADLAIALNDLADFRIAVTEKVHILLGPVQLPVPGNEHHRAFQYELLAMR